MTQTPGITPTTIIIDLYETLLGRLPGEEELSHWIDVLQKSSFRSMYKLFLSSTEYINRQGVVPGHPPGHFYSPIVDPKLVDVTKLLSPLSSTDEQLLGISLDRMEKFWNDNKDAILSSNFKRQQTHGYRFYLNNPIYSYADAIMLRAMLLIKKPHRVIEIGSGFSSAVMFDTADEGNWKPDTIICIEPYADRLKALIGTSARSVNVTIIEKNVQDVEIELFSTLEPGDILFIDSTHVMKTQSDVCFELFSILPILKPGVIIHFHDIFYPFEYPETWIMNFKYAWNELYALRAFLMYNKSFEVIFFNHMFGLLRNQFIAKSCPLYLEGIGGSLWMQKKQRLD